MCRTFVQKGCVQEASLYFTHVEDGSLYDPEYERLLRLQCQPACQTNAVVRQGETGTGIIWRSHRHI
jgi:hypothetical protein